MNLTKKEQQGYISKEDYDEITDIIQNKLLDLVIDAIMSNYRNLAVCERSVGIGRKYLWNIVHKEYKLSNKKIFELAEIFLKDK